MDKNISSASVKLSRMLFAAIFAFMLLLTIPCFAMAQTAEDGQQDSQLSIQNAEDVDSTPVSSVTQQATPIAQDAEGISTQGEDIEVQALSTVTTISNLLVTPSTVENDQTQIACSFKWAVQITGTEQTYFKAGDTIDIPTNMGDLFTFDESDITLKNPSTGVKIGTVHVAASKITVTFNEAAEDMQFTNWSGSVTLDGGLTAKALQTTGTDLVKTLTVGGAVGSASADVTWKGLTRKLIVSHSGQGTITNAAGAAADGTYTIDAATGDITITATPDTGKKIESVVFVDAAGVEHPVTVTNPDGQNFTIPAADVALGTSYYKVVFTPLPGWFDYTQLWKECWAGDETVDGLKHQAHFFLRVNGWSVANLYASNGASVGDVNKATNLLVEDPIPGTGGVRNLAIKACMPAYYKADSYTEENPVYKPINPGEWDGVDLISAGYATLLTQTSGETYDAFKARIMAANYNYGVYVDAAGSSTLLINLGSPGDVAAPGLKCSDLFASTLASDPVYEKLCGDDNAVGGKVQYFTVNFRGDHSAVESSQKYTNTATASYVDGTGAAKTPTASQTYTVTGASFDAAGDVGYLKIKKVDVASQSTAIAKVSFKLQIKDGEGAWVDYTSNGAVVSGTTDAGGLTNLGVLIPGDYRIVETSAPDSYGTGTAVFSTQTTSQGTINADGTFTVTAGDLDNTAHGFVALVTDAKVHNVYYAKNATAATGTLTDATNPYAEGAAWTVLAPSDNPTDTISWAGHTFLGWSLDHAATTPDADLTIGSNHAMGTSDVTLYAVWSTKNAKATASPNVTKAFTATSDARAADKQETFTFNIAADGNNPAAVSGLSATATQKDAGTLTAAFGSSVGFSTAGTYKFTITETTGSAAGYAYDKKSHTWEVVVVETSTGYNITSNKVDGIETAAPNVTFTNEYKAYTPSDPATSPSIVKALSGQTAPTSPTFNFTCTPDADNPTDGVTGVGTAASIAGAGTITAPFGSNIVFTKPGTYKFTYAETAGTTTGWKYDNAKYVWTATVENVSGKLTVTASTLTTGNAAATTATFTNTYTPTAGTYTVPTVTKALAGQTPAADETFAFAIAAEGAAPLPSAAATTVTGAGTASFGTISYDAAGTYVYHITETSADTVGWTYDPSIYDLTVTVTDNAGTLQATGVVTKDGKAADAILFTNTYQALSASVTPSVVKTVSGDTPETDSTFTFKMVAADGAPLPAAATGDTLLATHAGAGSVDMGSITYTTPGTYAYKISEVAGTDGAYVYDGTVYDMTVTVVDKSGQLSATVVYEKDGTVVTEADFDNVYTVPAGVTSTTKATTKSTLAKTGDESFLLPILFVMIGAGFVFVDAMRRRGEAGRR